MQLTPSLEKVYTQEQYTARDAQALAHLISWGPVVFQVARLMICYGIFEMLSEKDNGMTADGCVSAPDSRPMPSPVCSRQP